MEEKKDNIKGDDGGSLTEDKAKEALLKKRDDSPKDDLPKDDSPKEVTDNEQPIVKTKEGSIQSLGKVATPEVKRAEQETADRVEGLQIGYKNMPMESLPSKGKYYPKDFKLSFRSATLDEIKHYSSMDEADLIDVDEKIGMVLNVCIRITFSGNKGS